MSEVGESVREGDVRGTRVLVADDNPTVCRSTAAGLARAGFQVVTAFDGDKAIEQALATPPDVAVIDLFMPTVSGFEVLRALRRAQGDAIHLIAATANDTADTRHAAIEAGADGFVIKPTTTADLQVRIEIAAWRQRAFVDARVERETLERQRAYSQEAVALIAHDLRNAIMGCVSTLDLVSELVDLDGELADLVVSSTRSLRLMTTLVSNLLDVGRFEDAAVKPRVEMVSIRVLLENVVSLHAGTTGGLLGWEIDCDPALLARLDAGLIERVLHNLAGNARRYAGERGLVRVSARRWFELPAGSIEISVENSGPPVADDLAPNLFSKYAKGVDGNRGLGLYFCRLAAEAHGGEIDYATINGRPVFRVRLPGTA